MKRKKKQVFAYMTVEVSLLFPIIITILVCILYLVFYSYNQTIAFQNGAIAALYGKSFSYTEDENTRLADRTYTVLQKLNQNQYMAVNSFKQTVSIENNNIKITQNGNVKMPLFNENIMSRMDFTETNVVDIQNKVFYMRQIRKVKKNEN